MADFISNSANSGLNWFRAVLIGGSWARLAAREMADFTAKSAIPRLVGPRSNNEQVC